MGDRASDESTNGNVAVLHGASWGPRPAALAELGGFTGPGVSSEGLAWDGTSLWLAARNPNTIVRLDARIGMATGTCTAGNGCILGSFTPPGPFPEGLSWDGTYLWHADGTNIAYRLDGAAGIAAGTCTAGNGCVVESFNTPTAGSYLESLEWDGTYLWLSHSGAQRLYKLDVSVQRAQGACTPSNGCVVGSFMSPGSYPEGIATDGTRWLTTDASGRLYELDMDKGLTAGTCTGANGCVVDAHVTQASWPEDLAFSGARIWNVDLFGGMIYELGYQPAVRCKYGTCLELDGSNEDVVIQRSPTIDSIADGGTIEVWLLPRELRAQTIFRYGRDPGTETGLELRLSAAGTVGLVIGNGATSALIEGGAYTKEQWVHVAVTWDHATMTLYIAGQQVEASAGLSGPIAFGSTAGTIGSDSSARTFFNGTIDEMSVYTGARSAEQIRLTYEAKR